MSKKLKDEITELSREISDRILSIEELKALDELRVHVLGKKGKLTYFLKELKNYDSESRVEIGSLLNNLKNDLPATFWMWREFSYWLFKVPFGFSSPDYALSYRIFFWGWFLLTGVYYVRTGKNFWD